MITISDAAAEHIRKYLDNRGHGLGVRVGVKTTGCSGMAYVFEFVDEPREEDEVFEDKGVRVYIDPKSYVYIDGSEIDYKTEGLNSGFDFVNPNEKDRCGCGESFRV